MSNVNPGSPFPTFPSNGKATIHAGVSVAASGSSVVYPGANKVSLFVNVTAFGGTSIQYTLQEVDPGNGTTVLGPAVSTTLIVGVGIQRIDLPMVFGGAVKVAWTVVGTITTVFATLVSVMGSMAAVDYAGLDLTSAAGTSNASAQAVQGVAGGVPMPGATSGSSYSPNQSNYNTEVPTVLMTDASDRLETHSSITSDEGSFRDEFLGSSLLLAYTGTMTFANGSAVVTGAGTAFRTELRTGQYLKRNADGNAFWVQIESIDSDTILTLVSSYGGTSGTVGDLSNWAQSVGTGGASITVATSVVTLKSGATASQTTKITRNADYEPLSMPSYRVSITQRIANQSAIVGLTSNGTSAPAEGAFFRYTGLDSSLVECVSCSSTAAADQQVTIVKLPEGLISTSPVTLKVDVTNNAVTFTVGDDTMAIHDEHIPGPYTVLQQTLLIENNGSFAGTTTNLTCDCSTIQNFNQTQIAQDVSGEPVDVRSVDTITFATVGSLDANVSMDMAGQAGASFFFDNTGSFVGTLTAEWSVAGGTTNGLNGTWFPALMYNPSTRAVQNLVLTAGVSNGFSIISPAGAGYVRVRVSAHTIGDGKLSLRGTSTISGVQLVSSLDGAKSTYSACVSDFAPVVTPTDIISIFGSATKTIRITYVGISGTRTAATQTEFRLIKRSSANSGGAPPPTALTKVTHDSNNIAASAAVNSYAANPTLGTTVGSVRTQKVTLQVTASASAMTGVEFTFGNRPGAQAIVLRGTAEGLCINLGGTTMAGGALDIIIEWTEE